MDYSIEQLRNQYYESIRLLTDENDIINMLPKPEYDSFYSIMNGLTSLIELRIQEINEEIESLDDDLELIELAKEELGLLKFKKDICNKIIAQDNENILDIDNHNKMNIIFATTESNTVYIERDIKSFPEEYLDSIIESLKLLEKGMDESNYEKAKPLHYELTGLHEIKPFKVRVIYQILSDDCLYVIMAKMKKDDFSKKDRDEITTRFKKVSNEYKKIKNILSNPEKKIELINQNKEILDRLYGSLNEKRRGRNV